MQERDLLLNGSDANCSTLDNHFNLHSINEGTWRISKTAVHASTSV